MSLQSFFRKSLGQNAIPRQNVGACPFCGLPVFVAEGQAYKVYRDRPVHKKCRKLARHY